MMVPQDIVEEEGDDVAGCVTNIRRMLTLPRSGEEAVGGMKDARMAEPDSRVEELQDL